MGPAQASGACLRHFGGVVCGCSNRKGPSCSQTCDPCLVTQGLPCMWMCHVFLSSSFPPIQLPPTALWGWFPGRWTALWGFPSLPPKAALWRNGLTSLDSSLWAVPAHPHTVLSSPLEPCPAQSATALLCQKGPQHLLCQLPLASAPTPLGMCAHACGADPL